MFNYVYLRIKKMSENNPTFLKIFLIHKNYLPTLSMYEPVLVSILIVSPLLTKSGT